MGVGTAPARVAGGLAITVVFRLLALLGAYLVGLPVQSAAQPPDPTGLEYKFRLSPELSDKAQRNRLWELVTGVAVDEWPAGVKVKSKKCRLVQYLDTEHNSVQRHDFILRHRMKLDDDDCSAGEIPENSKGSLALKYRSEEARKSSEQAKEPWAREGEGKLEMDLLYSKTGDVLGMRRAFSVSAKHEDTQLPKDVAQARSLYPGALPFLAPDARLRVGCRRIFERVWELEPGNLKLPDEIELAVWYRRISRGSEALLAELSFKADANDPEAAIEADALANRLLRTLGPRWLADAGAKTETAYECE